MVILLSGYEMHLPGCEKMDARTFYWKIFKINHVRTRAIYEDTNLIVRVSMGLLRFMRVFLISYCLSRYFTHMKCDLFIAFG